MIILFLFFIFFFFCIVVLRAHVLFIFICFNKYKICPDNQPIYAQFRETSEGEQKKGADLCLQRTDFKN